MDNYSLCGVQQQIPVSSVGQTDLCISNISSKQATCQIQSSQQSTQLHRFEG